jgi:hypothetical protein
MRRKSSGFGTESIVDEWYRAVVGASASWRSTPSFVAALRGFEVP